MPEAIHIHEDDWAMRNLYPEEAADEVAEEMLAAYEAGERNRAPDGIGWTAIHMIKAPSIDYSKVGLTLADAAAALAPILPRTRLLNTTFPTLRDTERPASGAEEDWCFGASQDCFINLEPEGAFVRHIWFELRGSGSAEAAAIRLGIEAVDRLAPSYLADYRLSFATPADPEGLDEYFLRHAEREAEIASRA